ncbi:glycosyl transferase family 90 [Aliivibrio sp. S4TY2]|uniref:glycosyl transferase family 90 n=1 Tax=unclassified Aliivibrio TaxID=2645654 RepID=UPI002378C40C|nr:MULTISPECIES: glycosyl transferase family 90 [unclassified Aliivibrio]MDD9156003.1 glycosyl transferase family 90 [Aliivibrio sp. S4TY2]MDD9159712.1 glycosyl transferase family 90 [Aliivibrio sp. S4TY1]MDD9163712.1 glycosyl transferase family 90 [Aliivibrio sp. S4MY2]MDD9167712.1 glycosyl transferase family 90 [Aliivibrio sp. S4MY4]MDD9185624.1 glycosyl transferase family 90 [Aliivibrio sp. S4MY3]
MKNSKFFYYLSNALRYLLPAFISRMQRSSILKQKEHYNTDELMQRVNYYNKMATTFNLLDSPSVTSIEKFKKTKGWTYFFDIHSVVRYFPASHNFSYLNGDICTVPEQPSFLKSRPINSNNQNSVILKLNKIRHFKFVNDTKPYAEKKNMAAWRGVGYQPHRLVVIKQFYSHPMCNIGQTKPYNGDVWEKDFMSVEEQLDYKFLLAIEGNDVATNLKWAMSSNSVVIMSKPKYETWFMEGRLEADKHYVEVKDDYSDLIEKMEYYLAHEKEALEIIKNANLWTEQFKDKKREKLLSLMVADKYFHLSQHD